MVRPGEGCSSQVGFDEANPEQYVWYAPQIIAGLVTALGGGQAVADRLDNFTSKLNVGPNEPYLWAGNELTFLVPCLYNYTGQPWRTQASVDQTRSTLFSPTPDGEPGNDDLGAVSTRFIWAAMTGKFGDDESGTSTVTVKVADSVPDGY